MHKIYCDKCGKEITESIAFQDFKVLVIENIYGGTMSGSAEDEYQLCKDCFYKLKSKISNMINSKEGL
jgi:hypothetical protein